jgi:hypothetical protein
MLNRCEDRTDSQVNYVEFLEKLKVDVKPSDLEGLSTQIFNGSIEREIKRQEDLQYRFVLVFSTLCFQNFAFNL